MVKSQLFQEKKQNNRKYLIKYHKDYCIKDFNQKAVLSCRQHEREMTSQFQLQRKKTAEKKSPITVTKSLREPISLFKRGFRHINKA